MQKVNWTNVRANFIVDPPEDFGSGNKFADKWNIPKATLHFKATTLDEKGRTWWDDRKEHQEKVDLRVDEYLIQDKVKAKLNLIQSNEKLMNLVYDALLVRIQMKGFKITNENLAEFIKIWINLKDSYAKLQEIVNDVGGGKRIVYNINLTIDFLNEEGKQFIKEKYINDIPINYLNAKGIEFAKDRMDHPTKLLEDAVEAKYEEIPDEDDELSS